MQNTAQLHVDPDGLKPFASKYIWWKTADEAVTTPQRVIAQVMNIGDYADVQKLEHQVGEPNATEDQVLQAASQIDLMATKVKVILQSAEAKDYRDIAAMLGAGVSLPMGLAAAREFFGPNFQPSESLKAMVYFQDGDLHTISQADKNILIKAASAVRDLPQVEVISASLT
jgi:hypothetical protein